LSTGSRFAKLLSALRNEAVTLTDLYQSTLFIDFHVQKRDAHSAWGSWQGVRWRLLFARVLFFLSNRMKWKDNLSLRDR
jgi:hypothetical protein